ncbi:hypothetical protein GGF50DRAFT_120537 [Schizophyllum commune]
MGNDTRKVGNVTSFGDGRAFEVNSDLTANDIGNIVKWTERYIRKNNIADGEFMPDDIFMFSRPDDRSDIEMFAAANDLDWEELKLVDGSFDLVLRKVFLKYDSGQQVSHAQGLSRKHNKDTKVFALRYRGAIMNLLPADRPEPRTRASHIITNFEPDFAAFLVAPHSLSRHGTSTICSCATCCASPQSSQTTQPRSRLQTRESLRRKQ